MCVYVNGCLSPALKLSNHNPSGPLRYRTAYSNELAIILYNSWWIWIQSLPVADCITEISDRWMWMGMCGCRPNSIAVLLSFDKNEAIFCWMCITNVFSRKENELHVTDHSIEAKKTLLTFNIKPKPCHYTAGLSCSCFLPLCPWQKTADWLNCSGELP